MADRVWLDWNEPGVTAAARWLGGMPASADTGSLVDLGGTVCVVPGRRAGRSLLVALIEATGRRGLVPPHIITPGLLGETLLADPGAIATRAERVLAWMGVLRDAADTLAPLLPAPPPAGDVVAWHRLGTMIADLHLEISRERTTFAAVGEHADDMLMHGEAERWRCLHGLVPQYLEALVAARLADPAEVESRALAGGHLSPPDRVVLVAVTDLTAGERALLEAVDDRVVALVQAPADLADRFDPLGCVEPDAWASATIDVDDSQIVVADRAEDVAAATFDAIAALDGRHGPDAIAIGVADPRLDATLLRVGRGAGVDVHLATGRPLAATTPYRLLVAIADHLDEDRVATAAELVRHVDLEAWLEPRLDEDVSSPAAAIDRFRVERLPTRMGPPWPDRPGAEALHDTLSTLLAPLVAAPRPLGAWSRPIVDLLATVYEHDAGTRAPEAAERLADECELISVAAAAFASIPRELQPDVDGPTALRLLLAELGGATVPQEPRVDQVEALGWLELPLDPSPVLIVAGLNEGGAAGGSAADPFLPDGLRARAGLPCAARRHARDAWALSTLLQGRERVRLIVGRRQADGEPLTPSRLLLACDDHTLPRRILRLAGDGDEGHASRWPGAPAAAAASSFVPPAPAPGPVELDHLSVTAFKDYLLCPYRFHLKRIAKLRGVDDEVGELDALAFGTLAHEVLRVFGESPSVRDDDDPQRIAAFLSRALRDEATRRYGDNAPAAVRVQLARLEMRLKVFARRQARHRRDGWRIAEVEWKLPRGTALEVPGQDPLPITGTVDRIDVHEDGSATLIIDYKTSENPNTPDQAHRRDDAWVDLQLPLYRYLVPAEKTTGIVTPAYFALPRDLDAGGLLPAQWTEQEHATAIECAQQIVRDIRAGRFAINPDFPARYRDEFETICQTTVFGGTEAVTA